MQKKIINKLRFKNENTRILKTKNKLRFKNENKMNLKMKIK